MLGNVRRLRRVVVGSLLAVVLALSGCSAAAPPSAPLPVDYIRGPEGEIFYQAPAEATARAQPGSLIWARPAPGPSGSQSFTILYWSRKVSGEPVAVSGVVYAPTTGPAGSGPPPIVSWAHGTEGLDDRCGPSKFSGRLGTDPYALALRTLEAGRTFVASDFEGLGTPGDHPYIVSQAVARNAVDAIHAAADLTGWESRAPGVVVGHSEGAAAAMFAGARGQAEAPDVDLRGVVAISPPSNLTALVSVLNRGPYAGYMTMAVSGMYTAYPELRTTEALLTPAGRASLAKVKTQCSRPILEDAYFMDAGTLGVDRVLTAPPVVARLNENDPLSLPTLATPTLVLQGDRDDTIPVEATRRLVAGLCSRGAPIHGVFVPGAGHVDVIERGKDQVDSFLADRLGGTPMAKSPSCV